MIRRAFIDIAKWAESEERRPLVLRGARQVGKSYLVRWLARKKFAAFIEINFEKNPEHKSLFASNNVTEILALMEATFSIKVKPGQTLIFLDEVQAFPEILAKLRWFAEDAPTLHVVAAGSLLDFVLDEIEFSMPVGRISYLYLEPFSFSEFLLAIGEKNLFKFLRDFLRGQDIPESIHQKCLGLLRLYFLVGGMPRAVNTYRKTKDLKAVSRVHSELLTTYREDFNKYRKRVPVERLHKAYVSIPEQVGRKFVYSRVDREERVAAIKAAVQLLLSARVAHQVLASHCDGIPLGAQVDEKNFKLLFIDIGLLNFALGLNIAALSDLQNFWLIHEGAVAEQYVGQTLRAITPSFVDPQLHYWVREKSGADAEVDYVIQNDHTLLPIEVKAGKTGTLRSLHVMMKAKALKKALRLYADHPRSDRIKQEGFEYTLVSLPLYLADFYRNFLES